MADEEEDDEVCDSWEDLADSGELERRMEERDKIQMEKEMKIMKNDVPAKVPVIIQEDTNRTQYRPQLRILKRPDAGKDNAGKSEQDKSNTPVRKTLAERQAEYAEARARILGSACDSMEMSSTSEENKGEDRPSYMFQPAEEKPENVIRQPNGPDGSKGFKIRR